MSKKRPTDKRAKRRGTVILVCAGFIVPAILLTALAIDIGYLAMTKAQLQAAADSAALAGGTDLIKGLGAAPTLTSSQTQTLAQQSAVTMAAANRAGDKTSVYCNGGRDVRFGNAVLVNGSWQQSWGTAPFNMIGVTLHRDQAGGTSDGPLPMFFSGFVGASANVSVTASAALLPSNTFQVLPGSGLTAQIMPFTMDLGSWQQLMNGTGPDNYNYNSNSSSVSNGSDGIKEADIYPNGASGDTANRGTVNFGAPNNSTSDISRQITGGLNASDLSYFPNDTLSASSTTPLSATGDPGISNALKSALTSIIGQPRAMAVFQSAVAQNGHVTYSIVKFVGVRIVSVDMNGNPKHVWVQPATVVDPTLIPKLDATITQDSIFSPVVLIQ